MQLLQVPAGRRAAVALPQQRERVQLVSPVTSKCMCTCKGCTEMDPGHCRDRSKGCTE